MVLPDNIRYTIGTQIVLAQTTDYSPSQGQPARTDELNLENLAVGSYRQSAKFDFTANVNQWYSVVAFVEWFTAPTAGGNVDFWIGYSSSVTAANDNPGNLSGSDAAYNGYGAAAADAAEAVLQLDFIGSLVCTADVDIQHANLGWIRPRQRYGMIVAYNNSSIALAATDAADTAVVLTPLVTTIQDS